MLISLLKNSDLLVGTAKPLVEQLNTYLKKYNIENKLAVYLPNAVDEELFCGLKELPKPKDMITGEKTFLYYGSLWGSWFDWDLIKKLALHNENYSINIIGDYKNLTELISTLPKTFTF